MSITDGVLLDQGGAVFNVRSSAYGAKGDGTTDDAPAIQAALTAAGAAGGTVFIPRGTYLLGQMLDVPSNTTLQGVGEGSLLMNDGAAPQKILIQLVSVSNVRITDLAIDVCSQVNYTQAIYITNESATSDTGKHGHGKRKDLARDTAADPPGCRNVWVERCHIYNSGKACLTYTMMALDIRSSSDIWVRDNRIGEMEIKVGGGLGAQRVVVTGNQISNPYQYGISFVSDSNGGVVNDGVIADNVITNIAQAGGIYFGSDTNTLRMKIVCERVSVTGNLLSGAPRNDFIHGAISSTSSDWVIRGNIARQLDRKGAEPTQLEGCPPPKKKRHTAIVTGINVLPRKAGGTVENLVIADNVVAGTEAGIVLTGPGGGATGFVVQGNTLQDTRGIQVNGSAFAVGRITGNIVRGGGIQLVDCGPVDVQGNTVRTSASAAIAVQTSGAAEQVEASVSMNRLLVSTSGTMQHGVAESGPGTFNTSYFGNGITGNSGPALALAGPGAAQLFNAYTGSMPVRQLSGSTPCAARSVAAGATVTETIPVPGAGVGDGVTAACSAITTPGWQVSGAVTAAGTVTVSITNATGAAATLPAGTLGALVWGF